MFLGKKNQYENDYITKCNLQIQCDPYQITNGIFHRSRKKVCLIYTGKKKKRPQIAKTILRKET